MQLASLQKLAVMAPKAPYKPLSIKLCSHVQSKELLAPFYGMRSWGPEVAADGQAHRRFLLWLKLLLPLLQLHQGKQDPKKLVLICVYFPLYLPPGACINLLRSCPWG